MFIVDREQFIAWTNGIIFNREENGNVFIINQDVCEEAGKRLNKGEEIGFTINGELVSK